jgi:predicted site-specific integrase-resolvase
MTQRDQLLTASQVAERLTAAGVPTTDETVRAWAKSGRLDSIRTPSGRRWFEPSVVEDALTRERGGVDEAEEEAEVAS